MVHCLRISYIAQSCRYLRAEMWMLQIVIISVVSLLVLFMGSCWIPLFCSSSDCKLVSFSLDLRQKVAQIYVHLFWRRLYHIMIQIKVMFSALFWMPLRPLTGLIIANFFGYCWNVTYLRAYFECCYVSILIILFVYLGVACFQSTF